MEDGNLRRDPAALGPAPAAGDRWAEALERIGEAVRLLAVVDVGPTPRPELSPERASDVEAAAGRDGRA